MSSEQDVASTQSFHRDLENARVLIEDPPWRDNPQKYRKTAETILRRILTFDPQNQTAKLLLAKAEVPAPEPAPARSAQPDRPFVQARAAQPAQPVTPVTPKVQAAPAVAPAPSPRPAPPAPVAAQAPPRRLQQDLSFVVPTTEKRPKKKPARRPPWGLLGVAAIGAGGGLLLLLVHPTTTKSQYVPQAATATPPLVQVSEPVTAHKVAPVAEPAVVAEPATAEVAAPAAVPVPAPAPAQPSMVVKSELPRVAPIQTGTLAVSSPTTVDIYMGDQLVGSAPTTLVLPAGNQTVEYRHQDMRKTVTHVIKANETTTAMVTFDVPLQINARPWAQVSIDGPQRRSLGQTPLSDVRVPIGSLLIFENPNFPGKSYRVTGKETEIRMTFP